MTKLNNIQSAFASGHNVFFEDDNKNIFVTGDNTSQKTGIPSNDNFLPDLRKLDLNFQQDETLITIKSYPRNLVVQTTQALYFMPSNNTSAYNPNNIPTVRGNYASNDPDEDLNNACTLDSLIEMSFSRSISTNIPRSTDLAEESDLDARPISAEDITKSLFEQLPCFNSPDNEHNLDNDEDYGNEDMDDWDEDFETSSNSSRRDRIRAEEEAAAAEEAASRVLRPSAVRSVRLSAGRSVSTSSQTTSQTTSQPTPRLDQPSGYVPMDIRKKWKPLGWNDFQKLSSSEKDVYRRCASLRLSQDMESSAGWITEELLAIVLAQIDGQSPPEKKVILLPLPSPVLPSIKSSVIQSNTSNVTTQEAKSGHQIGRIFQDSKPFKIDNPEFVVFGDDSVLYGKSGKICIEIFNHSSRSNPERDNNNHSFAELSIRTNTDHANYEICLSFKPQIFVSCKQFLYLKSGNIHHIIVPNPTATHAVSWLYFTTILDLDHGKIYWSNIESTIYVVHENIVYYYSRMCQGLVEFTNRNKLEQFYFMSDGFSHDICVLNGQGVFIGSQRFEILNKPFPFTPTEIHLIPHNNEIHSSFRNFKQNFFLIVTYDQELSLPLGSGGPNTASRVSEIDGVICINTRGLKYYGLLHNRYFVFIESNRLCCVTRTFSLPSGNFQRIATFRNAVFYSRPQLPIEESAIQNAVIGRSVIISTEDAIYYPFIDGKFSKVIIDAKTREAQALIYNPKIFIDKALCEAIGNKALGRIITLNLHISSLQPNLFEFLGIIAAINTKSVEFRFLVGDNHEPQIPTIQAIQLMFENCLLEFATKHLAQNKCITEFNSQLMRYYSDEALMLFGKMIAIANNFGIRIPFHLPLLWIAAIRRKLPTYTALEYFLYYEDREKFKSLKSIKIEEGLSERDYIELLRSATRFIPQSPLIDIASMFTVSKKIADGFLSMTQISQIPQMNMQTIDYVLSGDYKSDNSDNSENPIEDIPTQEFENSNDVN